MKPINKRIENLLLVQLIPLAWMIWAGTSDMTMSNGDDVSTLSKVLVGATVGYSIVGLMLCIRETVSIMCTVWRGEK